MGVDKMQRFWMLNRWYIQLPPLFQRVPLWVSNPQAAKLYYVWPAATFVDHAYTKQITQYLRQFGIPLSFFHMPVTTSVALCHKATEHPWVTLFYNTSRERSHILVIWSSENSEDGYSRSLCNRYQSIYRTTQQHIPRHCYLQIECVRQNTVL